MASVSGATSSLNNSLRGVSGLATGIDRDMMIEKMTAGTTAKITKQKGAMTSLGWKQEAYQEVSSKILTLQDDFFSFASGANLKYADYFAKNQITPMGDEDVTKYVSATGTSNMLDYLSIAGVKQLAAKATRRSDTKGSSSGIDTNITSDLTSAVYTTSKLKGTQLKFAIYNPVDETFQNNVTFTFPTTYKETVVNGDGSTTEIVKDIDYSNPNTQELVEQLNKALESSNFELGKGGKIEFVMNGDQIGINATGDAQQYVIRDTSTALEGLGFDSGKLGADDKKDGISMGEFNNSAYKTSFQDAYASKQNLLQYLEGEKLSVTYGGQTKQIELLKSDDTVNSFSGGMTANADGTFSYDADSLAGIIQNRLDKAFGSGKVIVDASGGKISFKSKTESDGSSQSLTINADDAEVRKNLGISKNSSNNLSMDVSLWDNRDKLGFTGTYTDDDAGRAQFEADLSNFTINGTEIKGLTGSTTVNGMLDIINKTKDLGVKVSYLKGENQFVLMAEESGEGRKIQLGGMAETMFGTSNEALNNLDGKDAIIEMSYGGNITTTIRSSSNTFDLEGLKVTVNSEFGYKLDSSGNPTSQLDPSQAVTFSAKADVDGVTEQVKKFIEAYNELAKEINTQVTTRPNKTYGPLTEAQKAEMSEKSIENWENQAKKGLLYNDSTMRELSISMQAVFTSVLSYGVSNQDLEDMGISISDGWIDGGTITFDESKFKAAMTSDPEKVADVFAGGGSVRKGLAQIIEDTLTPYATRYPSRNGNSYGRLIEEAGSPKVPSSISRNQIYEQLQSMQKMIDKLNSQLKSEQDRYISKFTSMETLINQMNAQSSYLSQITG